MVMVVARAMGLVVRQPAARRGGLRLGCVGSGGPLPGRRLLASKVGRRGTRAGVVLRAAEVARPAEEHTAPVPIELEAELSESFMKYAMSTILGRALPDARDGLKPVHRRILFAMRELGLMPGTPFRKCARVVGEVLGKFHPHGDNSVYDALVRMAQDFVMSARLIDGHGNFGSVDADPPAAMRYTECKLTRFAAEALLNPEDLGKADRGAALDTRHRGAGRRGSAAGHPLDHGLIVHRLCLFLGRCPSSGAWAGPPLPSHPAPLAVAGKLRRIADHPPGDLGR